MCNVDDKEEELKGDGAKFRANKVLCGLGLEEASRIETSSGEKKSITVGVGGKKEQEMSQKTASN